MAEPTLSVARSEILQAVGDFFGFTRNQHVWSREETARVTRAMRLGEQQFYKPPRIDNDQPYSWRFLKPRIEIVISAPYATGTIAISSGTVTLTTGTWPAWAADGHLVVDGTGYSVASRTSNSVIVLDDTSLTVASGASYTLERWQYTLPDDFGGFIDPTLSYTPESNQLWDVAYVPVSEILRLRQYEIATDPPVYSITPVNSTTDSEGQRQELLIYPTPAIAGVLAGEYWAAQNATTDSLPYGMGTIHSDCLFASCLAAAELERDGKHGSWWQVFLERLSAAIAHDRRTGPRFIGYNGDPSVNNADCGPWRHSNSTPKYNGVSLADWS